MPLDRINFMTKRLGIAIILVAAISCSVPKATNDVDYDYKNVDKVFSKKDPLIIKGMDGEAQIYGKDKEGQFNIYPPTLFSFLKTKTMRL